MIFIAVSLGFFAENLRETIKDNNEIKENMNSILMDLESDVAHLKAVLDINTYSYRSSDSLIDLLHNDIGNTPKIYLHARTVTANVGYSYSNATVWFPGHRTPDNTRQEADCVNPERI